jgi:membrane protein YqaA with SNARE-associated domain
MNTDHPNPSHTRVETGHESPGIAPRTSQDWLRVLLPLALAILFSLTVFLLISKFQEQIKALKTYGYLGAFIVGFLGNATIILPVPSLAFTAALGGVLNPLLVGVAAGAGEALGEMTGYLAGVSGKAIIENRARYQVIQSYMDRYGGGGLFVLAAVPNPLFDLAGIAAGVMRFPVWKFLLYAWAGKTFKAIVFAGAGSRLF